MNCSPGAAFARRPFRVLGKPVTTVYQASPIKRQRSTKAEVEARREALLDIIEDGRPMTVRQVFYQATVRGIVEKTESGYAKVQTDLARDAPRRAICRTAGSPTTPAGSASRGPSTASRRRSNDTAQVLSQGAVGRRRLPTSRSGWRRTRSAGVDLSGHSPCTTCR